MSPRCSHHRDGRCTNALALPLYGDNPSRGICARCEHYAGPDRGLGDKVARIAQATGVARVVQTVARVSGKPCGCAARRAALNARFPTSYPQSESPNAAKVDEPTEPI